MLACLRRFVPLHGREQLVVLYQRYDTTGGDSMGDCIFCRIARGDIRADVVYKDDRVVAFRDINPQAPVHIQIIPLAHITGVAALTHEHNELIGHMVNVARQIALQEGIAERGYRLVMNQGGDAGQSVNHLHLHLIGGRRMSWPPG
jgi:histidine triad (HIT) family protein